MTKAEALKKARRLLALAADPGTNENEQRNAAHAAAKLCREHGIDIGGIAEPEPQVTRARAEVVIGGVRTVIETISAGRAGAESLFGFDVFGFAQGLLAERAKEVITAAVKNPAPKVRRKPKRAK